MFEGFILEQKVSHGLCHIKIPSPQVPSWLGQLCLHTVSIMFSFSVTNLNQIGGKRTREEKIRRNFDSSGKTNAHGEKFPLRI